MIGRPFPPPHPPTPCPFGTLVEVGKGKRFHDFMIPGAFSTVTYGLSRLCEGVVVNYLVHPTGISMCVKPNVTWRVGLSKCITLQDTICYVLLFFCCQYHVFDSDCNKSVRALDWKCHRHIYIHIYRQTDRHRENIL